MDLERLLANEVRSALRMIESGECGMNDEQRESAFRAIQYYKTGISHFTESTARGCIAQMYYYEGESDKVYAPFFDYKELEEEYKSLKDDIPDYNEWDFAVTMNLVYSNHHEAVSKWTKGRMMERIESLAVSFLNDEDTHHPTDKIWWYMNN